MNIFKNFGQGMDMQEQKKTFRKIIHIDMDAFYASVEQRDNPELKGKKLQLAARPREEVVLLQPAVMKQESLE